MRRVDLLLIGILAAGTPQLLSAQSHPANATALCRDGTYSQSMRASGTCSGHNGVAQWLATARCNDGTLSLSQTVQGTCANHGGVSLWYITGVCNDGTVTHAAKRQGACSRHGGVAQWLVEEDS